MKTMLQDIKERLEAGATIQEISLALGVGEDWLEMVLGADGFGLVESGEK